MAFSWKERKDIFKGEGNYHLTWAVVNRVPLLGTLESLPSPDAEGHNAWVRATPLGKAVLSECNNLKSRIPELEIIWKQLMPDHLHCVVWMHEGFEGSIKMVARGYAQGCSKIARRYASDMSVDAQSIVHMIRTKHWMPALTTPATVETELTPYSPHLLSEHFRTEGSLTGW